MVSVKLTGAVPDEPRHRAPKGRAAVTAASLGATIGLIVVIGLTEPTIERDLGGTLHEQVCDRLEALADDERVGAAEPWRGDAPEAAPPDPQTCSGASPPF